METHGRSRGKLAERARVARFQPSNDARAVEDMLARHLQQTLEVAASHGIQADRAGIKIGARQVLTAFFHTFKEP
ncbi:hypothetical protein CRG98_008937 [Punica granatum]|uniref:Uncharacterized protein n=1 Tax=Punica granatum TaxID=22663 RepID=A0A2I0KQC4_PUNGR|nr:hypothetical protein CRG98_008937 [Punica granatum]